jgi:IS4 transposase
MSQRVDAREWVQFQWPYLMAFFGGADRVDRLAYETGAFVRKRAFERPSDVLQLLMTWAVAERSLMETAALAAEAEMADVSDVALMKRFARSEAWLGALLGEYLVERGGSLHAPYRIRLLDATCVSRPGKTGSDLRLHVSMDLRSHRVDTVELTGAAGNEKLERFRFSANEIVVADRGYAHRSGLQHVARSGAYFVVRCPWSNLPLEHEDGTPFDILAALRTLNDAEAGEFRVAFRSPDGEVVPCRLVGIRKSEAAAERSRKKTTYERRKSTKIDVRTLEAAGYVFVVTNLPEEISAASVLELYALRWQIETKFKTLKSVLHLAKLPARSETLARVYLMAKLLVAFAIEDLIDAAESFPPWGYPIAAH